MLKAALEIIEAFLFEKVKLTFLQSNEERI